MIEEINETTTASEALRIYQNEKEASYFEEFDTRHEAMKLLSDAWWLTDDKELKGRITRAVGYIRDTAMDLIPYSCTTPNKGANGSRY
jgi:hypothetical protein